MTLVSFLIFIVAFAVVASLAYWVITKFLPAPAQMAALAIVGIILLIVLLGMFLPGVAGYRLW